MKVTFCSNVWKLRYKRLTDWKPWRIKSAASKKPVMLHSLVMGLLKNWRETTAYAGDEDFTFASDRLKGKQPRVPNMFVGIISVLRRSR
jgi:hypothetical protein